MQQQHPQKQQESLEVEYSDNSGEDADNDYGSALYWEKRYKKRAQQRFQWLQDYQALHKIIGQLVDIKIDPKILNIGCGNSKIQDDLYEAGYTNIMNNDISKIVIDQMQKIRVHKNYTKMKYQVMDVTAMTYPSKQFDLVLDKSTIDALLCSENPYLNTAKMLEEVYRVLKDDGVYLIISYGQPDNRLLHLKREHVSFTIQIRKLQKQTQNGNLIHWAYICRKDLTKHREQLDSKEWKKVFYENLQKLENQDYR